MIIVKQKNNKDYRGNLREIYSKKILKHDNFPFEYVQPLKKFIKRFSLPIKKSQQAKYVNVVKGKILDRY